MPKPVSSDFGVAVGHVVAVLVGIEQQVRRLQHPDAAVADRDAGGEVQARDEVLGLVVAAVAVGVFEDGDLVGALRPRGGGSGTRSYFVRRYWSTLTGLEAGGGGVLQVLHHPHPPALVEGDVDRLADHRLGRGQRDLQTVGRP